MAYREIGMWEILEVLRRVARSERQRAIARVTGHSRSTLRRWLRVAGTLGWEPDQGEPDEALARAVAQRVRPVRDEAAPGESQSRLLPHRDQIQAWLAPEDGSRGLRLSKVQQLLARQGVDVAYSSLHRFAVAHCGFSDRRRLTVCRAETAPGELAEVDFGRLGLVWDPEAERRLDEPDQACPSYGGGLEPMAGLRTERKGGGENRACSDRPTSVKLGTPPSLPDPSRATAKAVATSTRFANKASWKLEAN